MDNPIHGLGGDGRAGGHRRPLLRVQGLALQVLQPGGAVLRSVHSEGALLLGSGLESAGHPAADTGADLLQDGRPALGGAGDLLALLLEILHFLLQGVQVSPLLFQLGGDGRQPGLNLREPIRRSSEELQADPGQLARVATGVAGLQGPADHSHIVSLIHRLASNKIRMICCFLRAATWAASRSCCSASITPSSQERAEISVAGFAGIDTADTS